MSLATQKIFRIRRDYNSWVADESMEDYALRFTPRSFRKWSEFRVANTAFGATSFLALEAIGGVMALSYGFTNAVVGILIVALVTFLTGWDRFLLFCKVRRRTPAVVRGTQLVTPQTHKIFRIRREYNSWVAT